ncbi:MAG: 3-hydroxyacyl-ACP dehydratase FabZ [Elusimicrobia bacterium]|nr:3-hydroxyacyl-ACP dehydratase FabZ [Elusimicrobiota bacterium]
MELNIQEIQKIIPHRFPFLLIDRVVDLVPNEKLVAVKNVSVNEAHFQGHFPNEKIMPGVLMVEAMAQAGCIYFYYSKGLQGQDLIYYLAKTTAKFHKVVVPGDQLRIEIKTIKLLKANGFLDCRCFVGDDLACEAEIGLGVKPAA